MGLLTLVGLSMRHTETSTPPPNPVAHTEAGLVWHRLWGLSFVHLLGPSILTVIVFKDVLISGNDLKQILKDSLDLELYHESKKMHWEWLYIQVRNHIWFTHQLRPRICHQDCSPPPTLHPGPASIPCPSRSASESSPRLGYLINAELQAAPSNQWDLAGSDVWADRYTDTPSLETSP